MPRFHHTAKKWVESLPQLSDEDWQRVMDEDSWHPYNVYPTTHPPTQHQPTMSEAGSVSPAESDDNHREDMSDNDHEDIDEVQGNYVEV